MELIESDEAERRSGLRERARPESMPKSSRKRIFSLTWDGRSGSGRGRWSSMLCCCWCCSLILKLNVVAGFVVTLMLLLLLLLLGSIEDGERHRERRPDMLCW